MKCKTINSTEVSKSLINAVKYAWEDRFLGIDESDEIEKLKAVDGFFYSLDPEYMIDLRETWISQSNWNLSLFDWACVILKNA